MVRYRRETWLERLYLTVTPLEVVLGRLSAVEVGGVDGGVAGLIGQLDENRSSSRQIRIGVLDSVREDWEAPVPILEVITDHGSEFINTHQDERPCLDHEFERYLNEHEIKHTICKVCRHQSNGNIGRFFQTYDKYRFGSELLTSSSPLQRGASPPESRLGQS